jgi:hypothetical protein
MVALAAMSQGWQAFFYGAAFICFVAAAVITRSLVAAGLALFSVVFAYQALAAA